MGSAIFADEMKISKGHLDQQVSEGPASVADLQHKVGGSGSSKAQRKATKKQFIHEATKVALAMNGEVHTQTKEIQEPSVCTT